MYSLDQSYQGKNNQKTPISVSWVTAQMIAATISYVGMAGLTADLAGM